MPLNRMQLRETASQNRIYKDTLNEQSSLQKTKDFQPVSHGYLTSEGKGRGLFTDPNKGDNLLVE